MRSTDEVPVSARTSEAPTPYTSGTCRSQGRFTGASDEPEFGPLYDLVRHANAAAKKLRGPQQACAYRVKHDILSTLIQADRVRVNGKWATPKVALDILAEPPFPMHADLRGLTLPARTAIREQLESARVVSPLRERLPREMVTRLEEWNHDRRPARNRVGSWAGGRAAANGSVEQNSFSDIGKFGV